MSIYLRGLDLIAGDILGYCRYVPYGIMAALVYYLYRRIRFGKVSDLPAREQRRLVARLVFIVYLSVVLAITFFNRWEGYADTVELSLFTRLYRSRYYLVELVENIILFVPYGLLIPLVSEKLAPFLPAMASGFLLSLSIELAQHLTSRGYCQLDDLITNTFGALLGWLLSRIIHAVLERKARRVGAAFRSTRQNG